MEPDWPTFAVHQYVECLLDAPLSVSSTLVEVQFQPRENSNEILLTEGLSDTLRVLRQNHEWNIFLKGHVSQTLWSLSFHTLQPSLEEGLNDILDTIEETHPITYTLSWAVCGMLLSPLELIRTRLIVQSSVEKHYRFGPIIGLISTMTDESDSISSLYSTRLLIPTCLMYTLGPLIRILGFSFVESLGLDAFFDPILYRLGCLSVLALECLIITPIDLARKRLYCQSLSKERYLSQEGNKPVLFKTVVSVSPYWYPGLGSTLTSVLAFEGGRRRNEPMIPTDPEWASVLGGGIRSSNVVTKVSGFFDGLQSLYRAYWIRYCSMVLSYLSREIYKDSF